MTEISRKEKLEALQRQIQERAMRLTDLEVIIQDYQREHQRLLEEIVALKEQLWELMASQEQ